MAELAENTSIKKIEYTNLLHTAEACIEWHAWYRDMEGELWQMDMIHIQEGSRYDGYFERATERISAVLTDEMRLAIPKLKYRNARYGKDYGSGVLSSCDSGMVYVVIRNLRNGEDCIRRWVW